MSSIILDPKTNKTYVGEINTPHKRDLIVGNVVQVDIKRKESVNTLDVQDKPSNEKVEKAEECESLCKDF